MKRFLVLLLLTALPGCVGFEDSYYEDAGQEWLVPPSGGCQAGSYQHPMVISAIPPASGVVPTAAQLPVIQTREPDMLQPTR